MGIKQILKQLVQKVGFDLIRYDPKQVGRSPYVDIRRCVTKSNATIFDVGANMGQTVLELRALFAEEHTIHSFEPSPTTFGILEKNTSKYKNVHLWNYGLGAKKSELLLNETSGTDMSSFLQQGKKGWGDIVAKTLVPVTTIDSFCKEHNIPNIDVLKLDVQGFELEIFKGATQAMANGKIGMLYFEVTFMEMYENLPSFSDLYATAIENDFELIAIYPLYYRNNKAGWTDVLFKHKSYT